jgi:large conductance mechanosensitive channel
MGFWQDFKAFAFKGNVVDLAVAVIIGGAFGKIVTALVEDVVMPLVGYLTPSGKKFTDLFFVLKPGKTHVEYKALADARADGANIFAYGDFIQTIVDFMIIAFFIFLAIKLMSRFKKKQDAATPAVSSTDQLLMEIRDQLKKNSPAA